MSEFYDCLVTTKSPEDNRDWVLESIINYKQDLPAKVDYRVYLTGIRNQGNLGTCAAHTAACMKEYQERKDIGYKNYLSPMFVYNNRINQNTEGMHGRDVMKILSTLGICSETLLRHGTFLKPYNIPVECYNLAANLKIKAYAKINTLKGLKTALVLYGPCYIAFPTYNKTTEMWKPLYKGQKPIGGHAMTVVGYTENSFIIRNSWGKSWGKNGYCFYPFDDFGCHWEIWTTVDDDTTVDIEAFTKKHTPKRKFCICF